MTDQERVHCGPSMVENITLDTRFECKKKLKAERARSAKLLEALQEIARLNSTERQIENLNPFVPSDAQIARHAIAEYEAGK